MENFEIYRTMEERFKALNDRIGNLDDEVRELRSINSSLEGKLEHFIDVSLDFYDKHRGRIWKTMKNID